MSHAPNLDLLQAVDVGVLVVDVVSQTILHANPKAIDDLGWTQTELEGRRFGTLLFVPQTAAAHTLDLEYPQEPTERVLLASKGRHLPVLLVARPMDTAGGRLSIVTFTDISPLKWAVHKYESFFDHAVEGIFQSTADGRFITVNPALADILGYDNPCDLIHSLTDLRSQLYVDPADRDLLIEKLAVSGRVTGLETRFRRKDGGVKWISQAARVVRDENGELLYIEGLNIDITARKEAEANLALIEQSLRESEEKFRRTFHQSPVGAAILDLDFILLFANDAFCRIVGYTEEELKGTSIYKLTHPDDLANSQERASKLLSGEIDRYEFDKRYIHKDGRTIWVSLSAGLVRDTEGKSVLYLPIVQDITQRKMAEEKLARAEARYRAIVEDQTELVSRFTPDGALTFVNEAFAKFFGKTKEELTGTKFFPLVPSKDRPVLLKHLKSLAPARPVETIEHRLILADGSERWQQRIDRALFDPAGRLLEYQSVGRDITDRVTSEQALARVQEEKDRLQLNLEAVFRSIPDAIIVVDTRMRVLQTNRVLPEICCVGGEMSRGKHLRLISGHCNRACFEVLATTLKTRQPISEYRVECKGHHPGKTLVINSSPLLDANNDFTGAVLAIRDITRLADLERRLTDMHDHGGLIGKSKCMQDIYAVLDQLAELESTVLVTGQSGTGKELVAEALHQGGSRAAGPLIKVNCSALSEGLLESELFGHVRGAFTGAIRDKVGRFEAAEGGTIFLDEIGDISPRIQLNLLRVLERKEFERVGDSKTKRANVRVIAATNVDLMDKIRLGLFREDLYYRLKVMVIHMPPLCERSEDIPLLTEHFIGQFRQSFGKPIERCSEAVMGLFMHYHWPGNVRELKYALEHACILCPGGEIRPGHLPADLTRLNAAHQHTLNPSVLAPDPKYKRLTREDILKALMTSANNRAKAARLLGVDRKTLYRNMGKHHIQ